MRTDTTGAETTSSESLKSFDSDGFTLGTQQNVNASANNDNSFVAWNWKKTATAGFDIVSYTGNGSNRTISHSLSAVPKMMIVKNRDAAEEWTIYHAGNTSAPATDYLALDNQNATTDSDSRWNDTAPTSSVFTVGTSGVVNANGQKFINYLFSEVKGYSKFSSYIGNGNANGAFIYCGFKPAWILTKKSSASGDSWNLHDSTRSPINPANKRLTPDTSDVEADSAQYDLLSNGFKALQTTGSTNGSGATYIFMAFAENPFVTSGGVPTTAR